MPEKGKKVWTVLDFEQFVLELSKLHGKKHNSVVARNQRFINDPEIFNALGELNNL